MSTTDNGDDFFTVYGEISPEILDREIEIALSAAGSKTLPGRWKNTKGKVRDLLNTIFSVHVEGEKEGLAFLQGGVINGERKAKAIRHLEMLVLDLDTGDDIDVVRQKIMDLGLFSLIYSTHSHLKPVTNVPHDAVVKWSSNPRPMAKDVSAFLQSEKRYRPYILEGCEIIKTEHVEEGIHIFLKHLPMPKFRVIFLLDKPFVIAERGGTQAEALAEWKARYFGAAKMIGAHADRSCTDASRLFYSPRHPIGSTGFKIAVIAGKTLDINTVERVTDAMLREESTDVFERAAKAMSADAGGEFQTQGLKAWAGKKARYFEAVDFFEAHMGEEDRGPMSSGNGRIYRCPNDDAHSDAGNSDDKGFFAINASEGDNGFAMKCKHDSCAGLDRLGLLDKFLVDNNLGLSHLNEHLFEDVTAQEDAKAAKPQANENTTTTYANPAQAKAAAEQCPQGDSKSAARIAVAIGASGFSAPEMQDVLKVLRTASGAGQKALMDEVKKGERARQTSALEAGVDAETLEKLEAWNKRFAIVQIGGQVKVMSMPEEPGRHPKLTDYGAFRIFHANNNIVEIGADGKPQKKELVEIWKGWVGRRSYTNIVFEPGWSQEKTEAEGAYNIWSGFPVQGKPGDWSLLRGHLRDNICQGVQEYFDFAMTWLAHIYQFPGEKKGSAFCIKGARGAGKSKMFDWVRRSMGAHGGKASQRSHITGNFNGHQEALCLLVCEEAVWAGNHQDESALKDMITDQKMMMEKKGLDVIEVSSHVRLAMLSNEDWMVPAALSDERRFFVLECGKGRLQDIEFFAAVDQQMENGGMEAMVYELRNWVPPQARGWDCLRVPPVTPWLKEQANEGLDAWVRFFITLAEDGKIAPNKQEEEALIEPIKLRMDGVNFVDVRALRHHFYNFITKNGNGRQKYGNTKFFDDLVGRYLIPARGNVMAKREGNTWVTAQKLAASGAIVDYDELSDHYVIPSLAAIREHMQRIGVTFRRMAEEA